MRNLNDDYSLFVEIVFSICSIVGDTEHRKIMKQMDSKGAWSDVFLVKYWDYNE